MSDHDAPPNANSLLGFAAVFVVAIAAIFGVIGLLRDDTPGLEVLDGDDGAVAASPEPTQTVTDTPTPTATATSTEATPTPTATPTDTAADIDPATISVQVLDGTGDDAAAFQAVIDQLTDAGYEVVATFESRRVYERTTVFFTPGGDGNEEAAAQAAALIGSEVVLATPDDVNLSDTVRIHIVVGEDS